MSGLSQEQLVQEWQQSADGLTDLLSQPIESASVPGGSLSPRVAAAAALAAGSLGARTTQWLDWNSRKLPKMLLGDSYPTLRARLLGRGVKKSA